MSIVKKRLALSDRSVEAIADIEEILDILTTGDHDGVGHEVWIPDCMMETLTKALQREVLYLESTEIRPHSRWIAKTGAPVKVDFGAVHCLVKKCVEDNPPLMTDKVMDSIINTYDVDDRTAQKALLNYTWGKDPDEYFAFENYKKDNPFPKMPKRLDYPSEEAWMEAGDNFKKQLHQYREAFEEECKKNN